MFTLTKTQFYGSDAFKIVFDDWYSFNSFGPFFDILDGYAEETGIEPKQIQLIYQYQFIEDERKTEFYWDDYCSIYVFNISQFQYQKIHERLKKICADLNHRINEKKRLEPPPTEKIYVKDYNKAVFTLYCPKEKNIIEIRLNGYEYVGIAPYYDILQRYCTETGILPKTVTMFYNYVFVEDEYNIQFYWDQHMTVYVFYIAPEQYDLIYSRLKKICGELNREIREKLYSERKNKIIYREPPPYYRDKHKRY